MYMTLEFARQGRSSPATFAEQAFARIHADILSAKLRPDEKMHIERLSAAYGVGSTPLREALSKLSAMDLLRSEGQRGFRVAPVPIQDLLDITKTRSWIEGVALRAAIRSGDRVWEAEILAAAHRLKKCPKMTGDRLTDDWNSENRLFHDALVACCHSKQMMMFRAHLYDLSERYRQLSVKNGLAGRDVDAEHQSIMDAVLSRDADTAVELTEDHFIETTRIILSGELGDPAEVDRTVATLRAEIKHDV